MSKQIVDGEVDFMGSNDRTPLHLAVSDNNAAIVKILVCTESQESFHVLGMYLGYFLLFVLVGKPCEFLDARQGRHDPCCTCSGEGIC